MRCITFAARSESERRHQHGRLARAGQALGRAPDGRRERSPWRTRRPSAASPPASSCEAAGRPDRDRCRRAARPAGAAGRRRRARCRCHCRCRWRGATPAIAGTGLGALSRCSSERRIGASSSRSQTGSSIVLRFAAAQRARGEEQEDERGDAEQRVLGVAEHAAGRARGTRGRAWRTRPGRSRSCLRAWSGCRRRW